MDELLKLLSKAGKGTARLAPRAGKVVAEGLEKSGKFAGRTVGAARGAMWGLDDKAMKPAVTKIADMLRNARDGCKTLKAIASDPAVDEFLKALKKLNTPQGRKGIAATGMGLGGLSILDALTNAPEYEDVQSQYQQPVPTY